MAPRKKTSTSNAESSNAAMSNLGFKKEDYVHEECIATYTRYCRTRSVLQQRAIHASSLLGMNLSDIAEILDREKLDIFCDLRTKYHETLVRIFYAGLQERNGAEFQFRFGRNTYTFTADLWFHLFEMNTGTRITGDELLQYTETSVVDYDSDVFASSITQNGRIRVLMGTVKLNVNARVVYWIVSHILRPKTAQSRMDKKDLDMMFLLMEDKQVDWPHYIVSRMFDLRNSSCDQCFGCYSMIGIILKHFRLVQNLPIEYTSPGKLEIFSTTQLAKMYWFLNNENEYEYHGQASDNEEEAEGVAVNAPVPLRDLIIVKTHENIVEYI